MFDYNIAKTADNASFRDVCRKIEQLFPNCQKNNIVIDVDGSLIQEYIIAGNTVTVFNDYEIDAVYIKSEVNLHFAF